MIQNIEEKSREFFNKWSETSLKQATKYSLNHIIFSEIKHTHIPNYPEDIISRNELKNKALEENKLFFVNKRPNRYNDSDDIYGNLSLAYDDGDRWCCELNNVVMFGKNGLVIDDDNKLVLESANNYTSYLKNGLNSFGDDLLIYMIKRQINPKQHEQQREPNHVFNMVYHKGPEWNYGYWLLEYLPLLLPLKHYEKKTEKKPKIMINHNPPDFMIDSIAFLGFDRERIVEKRKNTYTVDKLILSSSGMIRGTTLEKMNIFPIDYQWLRCQAFKNLDDIQDSNKRLYLSRQNMDTKYVSNFDDIKPILEKYDFQIICPEKMRFREQVKYMLESNIIIGPSGSQMHNSVFAREGTAIIELFPPNYITPKQRLVSKCLGHNYRSHIASGYPNNGTENKKRHIPFRINPKNLEAVIKDIKKSS